MESLAQVGPLYEMEKEGGFKRGDPRGVAFTTSRLAAGATAVRDMIVQAWEESASTAVGYPGMRSAAFARRCGRHREGDRGESSCRGPV